MPADYKVLQEKDYAESFGVKHAFALDILVGLSEMPKRIPSKYLYDKNGSDIFLERVEELMREKFKVADVIHATKLTFARPAPAEMITQLADQCDFVIEGLAD